MKKAITLTFMVLAFITFSLAQTPNITGQWRGTANGFELNYTFKVDGEKLTGSSKSPDGTDTPIKEGVIKGNNLSFTIDIMGGAKKVTGTIKGDVVSLFFKDFGSTVDLKRVK